MTVKTINHIYDLLVMDEAAKQSTLRMLREKRARLENEKPDETEAIELAQEACDKAWKVWSDALNALQEFEEKEWN